MTEFLRKMLHKTTSKQNFCTSGKYAHRIKKFIFCAVLCSVNTCFAAFGSDGGFFGSSTTSNSSFMSSMEQRLVSFVHKSVAGLRYSVYQLGGSRFDPSRGVYVLDCSGYVDNILQTIYPEAYSNLVNYTGSEKPTTQHYSQFIKGLTEDPSDYWNKVDHIEQLRAGDILVFRYKNSRGRETGGHVMVVMDKPVREDGDFLVRVADSAPAGHSEDTRQSHTSGIGIGTLLLKANPKTGHPSAFAWKVGSCWKKNVSFAMARPIANTTVD